jgi:hypothetical protein
LLLCFFCFSVSAVTAVATVSKHKTNLFKINPQTQGMTKQQNTAYQKITSAVGVQQRLGDGFGKFGRNGSFWAWKFTWLDSSQDATGYDSGFLTNEKATFFDRLKMRFGKKVLCDKYKNSTGNPKYKAKVGVPYVELTNRFDVCLLGDTSASDIVLFSVGITWQEYNGIKYRHLAFRLNDEACQNFYQGNLKYLKEIFAAWHLAVRTMYTSPMQQTSAVDKIKALNTEISQSKGFTEVALHLDKQPSTPPAVGRTGETTELKDIALPQLNTTKGNETNETGKALFSKFLQNVQAINFDFYLAMAENEVAFARYDGTTLTVAVGNAAFQEQMESTYYDDFATIVRNVFGKTIRVNYALQNTTKPLINS